MTTLSLDLAKELQEVCKAKGMWIPESYHQWWQDGQQAHDNLPPQFVVRHEQPDHGWFKTAPAFLLCELLEWLPHSIYKDGEVFLININKGSDGYGAIYEIHYDTGEWHYLVDFVEENPANACAKLLIWLIKEGLI